MLRSVKPKALPQPPVDFAVSTTTFLDAKPAGPPIIVRGYHSYYHTVMEARKRERPILPASSRPSEAVDKQQDEDSQPQKQRRRPAHIACNNCRLQKKSCDGDRPRCTTCRRRQLDCVYRQWQRGSNAGTTEQLGALQNQLQAHQEFLDYLRFLPDHEAMGVLAQLRLVPDVSYLLSRVNGGVFLRNYLSEHKTARAMSPCTQSEVEFELMAQYQTAYPKLPVVDPESIDAVFSSPSRISKACTPKTQSNQEKEPFVREGSHSDKLVTRNNGEAFHQLSCPMGPSMPPLYCDDILRQLDISYWIKVPVSNEVAARLISYYLMTDYSSFGIFDSDLFLEDLVGHGLQFCSSFLVCSILYLSSQGYIAVDPKSAYLTTAFFQEAEMLWHGEMADDSVTTVAAIEIFSFACMLHGNDSLGREASLAGRCMAERLGLFGVPFEHSLAQSLRDMSPDCVRSASYTAWGAYNWLTTIVFFLEQQPIPFPPSLPVPGDTRVSDNNTLKAPPPPLCRFVGREFPSSCKLWTIVQEVAAVYRMDSDIPVCERVPMAFAEAKCRKLFTWANTIKDDVALDACSPLNMTLFHLMLHYAVVLTLHPFINTPRTHRLRSFTSYDSHPRAIYAASINQIKQLVLQCYTYNLTTFRCALLNPGLLTLCTALLVDIPDPQWKPYFLIAFYCWKSLYVCFPVFHDIAKGILSLAMQKKAFAKSEARAMMDEFKKSGLHHAAAEDPMTSFVFDWLVSLASPSEAQMRLMSLKFDELVLVDELTAVDGSD